MVTTVLAPRSLAGAPAWLWTRLLAVFLALHGLAPLAGTTDSLRLTGDGGAAEYLGGAGRSQTRPSWAPWRWPGAPAGRCGGDRP